MRVRVRWLMTFLLMAPAAWAEDECDCSKKPWRPDPPCYSKCISAVLFYASADELHGELDLPKRLVRQILSARDQSESRDEILEHLADDQVRKVGEQIDRASERAVRTLVDDVWVQMRRNEPSAVAELFLEGYDPTSIEMEFAPGDRLLTVTAGSGRETGDEPAAADAADEGGDDGM